MRRTRRLVRLAGAALIVAAISQEMSRPEAERTWHGKVFGLVPYSFRPPTWDRIRESYWNPDDSRLFTDRVFGVGWAINLHQASRRLEDGFRLLMGEQGEGDEQGRRARRPRARRATGRAAAS